ncbi:Uncharacterised protein [Pseudomonas aeruginosa]|nr:hypothetical protein V552_01354 [Pseudomonas aeruginosa BWH051]VFT09614.1 Uncharacterised protein [Pseudomonas aeruginosa]
MARLGFITPSDFFQGCGRGGILRLQCFSPFPELSHLGPFKRTTITKQPGRDPSPVYLADQKSVQERFVLELFDDFPHGFCRPNTVCANR